MHTYTHTRIHTNMGTYNIHTHASTHTYVYTYKQTYRHSPRTRLIKGTTFKVFVGRTRAQLGGFSYEEKGSHLKIFFGEPVLIVELSK